MVIKKLAVAAALVGTGLAAQAQIALAESFNDVVALAGTGWLALNNSPSPGTNWFQGNPGIFPAASGASDAYAAANFLGTTAASGPVSTWLITPQLVLGVGSNIAFNVRVAGGGYLDTLQVLMSTTGTAPANFTLLGSYSASTDAGWVPRTVLTGLAGQAQAFIAFRYVVDNVAVDGNYLGLDSLVINAVPEPATALLLALGVAGLIGYQSRRRQAA